ncbi:NERD domain-containing protein [Microbispora sp. NBC_01189]|uniref:nuclease-related domain-containing protein n=1 Tax=unclassified Microbispora TaxID=2614687 RepID=UPI002E0EEA25|nr:NERD domain-containing protein [Microbispora sp. NBC_01189]
MERASLRGLLQDPRYGHLRRRALVAVAAGLVFGVLLGGWRIGLTAAILAWAADSVYRARTMSTVPAWRRASAAERRTEAQLKKLERNGYLTLHARAIPGSEAQIDHLVVGPTGVYAVDSEKWDKRLPVRVQTHRKLFHGPFNRKPRLDEARWEAAQASDLISKALGREITVVPSLAIYGPAIPWRILNIRDVDVFSGGLVRKWITKRERSLTTAEIDAIYRAAERVLPARYPE